MVDTKHQTDAADALVAMVRLACEPALPVGEFRKLRREAVYLTRRLVRNYIAAQWREDLKASAALGPVNGLHGVPKDSDYTKRSVVPGIFCGE